MNLLVSNVKLNTYFRILCKYCIICMPGLGMLFVQRTVLRSISFEQGRCRKIRVYRKVSPGKYAIITDI
jgi:hypothetical protein